MKRIYSGRHCLLALGAVFVILCAAPLAAQTGLPVPPGDKPGEDRILDFLKNLESSSASDRNGGPGPEGIFSIDRGFARRTALSLRVSPSGRYLAVANLDKSVTVFDLITGKEERRIVPAPGAGNRGLVTRLAFSPDDRLLAAGGRFTEKNAYAVEIFDVATGAPLQLLKPGDEWPITFLDFSGDGRYLAAASSRPAVCIWETKDNFKESSLLPGDYASIEGAAFTGTGDGLALAVITDGTRLKLYSPAKRQYVVDFAATVRLRGLSGGGRGLAAWGGNGEVLLFDSALTFKNELRAESAPEKIIFSADGAPLLGAGPKGVWRERSGRTESVPLDGLADLIGRGKGGTIFYLRSDKAGVWSWNPADGKTREAIAGSAYRVKGVGVGGGVFTIGGDTPSASMVFDPQRLAFVQGGAFSTGLPGKRLTIKTADASLELEESGRRRVPWLFLSTSGTGKKTALQPVNGSFRGFVDNNLILVQDGACSVAAYNGAGERLTSLEGVRGFVEDAVFDDECLVLLDSYAVLNVYLRKDIRSGVTAFPFLCFAAGADGGWVCWSRGGHYAAGGGGEKLLLQYRDRKDAAAADFLRASWFARVLDQPEFVRTLWEKKNYREAESEVPVERLSAVDPEGGYFLSNPPPGWMKAGAGSQNANIRQFYMNVREGAFFMLSAMPAEDPVFNADLKDVAAWQLKNLKNIMTSTVVHSNEEYALRGRKGRLLYFSGTMGTVSLNNYCWYWFERGRYYSLFCWFSREGVEADQRRIALEVFSCFDTIPVGDGVSPPGPGRRFASRLFGYSVEYADSGWAPWRGATDLAFSVETGGTFGGEAAFFVIPLFTGDLSPAPEALVYAFLDSLDVQYKPTDLLNYRRLNDGALKGLEFDVRQKTRRYHFRIVANARFAWCLGVMTKPDAAPDADRLDSLYRIVRFDAAYEREVDPGSLTPGEASVQARLLNLLGLYAFENHQYPQAVRDFRAAAERGEKDHVILENYLRAACTTREYAPALAFLEAHLDAFPDNLLLLSYRAYLRKQTGLRERAAEDYRTIFGRGYRDDYDFRDYLDLLWDLGRKGDAFAAVAEYQGKAFSPVVAVAEASLRRRAGEYDKALAILKNLFDTTPYDLDTATALVETLKDMGRNQEALELCRRVIDEGHPSAEIYYDKGQNELALKWYREAKASFEEALRLYPQNETIKEYLDYTSRLIGEGDNSSLKEEIPAVPAAEEYLRTPDESVLAGYSGYDAYYINRVTAIDYRKDKEFRITVYYRVKVLTQSGLKYFSTFDFPFLPLDESIYVNSAEVRDADGKLRSQGSVSDYFVAGDPQAPPTSSDKVLHIPLSGLHPGDTIDLVITRRRALSNAGPRFYREHLVKYFPIINNYFILSGDTGDISWESDNIDPPAKTAAGLVWRGPSRDVFTMESYARNPDEYFASVSLAAPSRTWEGVGREYLGMIRPKLTLTRGVKTLAAGIVKGLKSREARVDALAAYVQKNYLYKAIMFGPRAYIPNDADTIIRNKYGDCKDHSVLLHLLLEAVGIPSRLALVNPQEHVSAKLPDGDQFNHMIVFVPGVRGGVYIDATNKLYPAGRLVPPGLGERDVLILDPAHPRLARLPSYPADAYQVVSDRKIAVDANGNASVHERLEFHNYAAAYLRSSLQGIEPNRRQTELQDYMAKADSGVRLDALAIDNLEEPSRPLVLTLTYRIEKAFKKLDGKLTAGPPDVWEKLNIQVVHMAERRTPFRIYMTETYKSTVRLTPPAGFTVVKTTPLKREGKKRFLQWRLARAFSAKGLTLEFGYTLNAGAYPKEAYADFEKAASAALSDLEDQVVLKRGR